ncbi:MAG TPA: sulfatase [Candidatus Polarisedimenticolia bacterium]|nr:sulfatase [Candidatus Polarisedimenticolia bacterium]
MTAASRAPKVAALGLVLLSGCGGAGRPNILLIVVDTARADRFSFAGYARPTSPEIAHLASEGTIYERAYTPAPWTLPAHASLFTGLFPSSHGADSGHLRLDDEFRTLAECLHDAGYRTQGYAANPWVGRQYGLAQGFDTYEEIRKEGRGGEEDAGAKALNARVERFLEWRGDNPDARRQPFFIFINYLELHLPYDPPEPSGSRFLPAGVDRAAVERLRRFKHPDEVRYVLGLGGPSGDDLSILSDLYDGEIAYIDGRVGDLARFLREKGLLDETFLIVTSDHGEAIGDHGFLDHKMNVFDELLRIPLVVRHPGTVKAGRRIREPVMLQDLYPTLLALAHAPPGQTPGGASGPRESFLLPGIDGLGAPAGPARETGERTLVAEFARPIQFLEIIEQRFPEATIGPWDRELVAYRRGDEKLHWASDGRDRLYDLAADPGETTDLAVTRADRVRELTAEVESWLRRPSARPPLRLPDR